MFLNKIFKKNKEINPPDWWETYTDFFKVKWDRSVPVERVRFIVFDTETSGLDYKKDRIIQIGAVEVENFQINLGNSLELLVNQDQVGTASELAVHGIRQTRIAAGFSEEEALKKFFLFAQNAILIGHHVAFDIAILNQALQNHFGLKMLNKSIDTAQLTQRLEQPVGYHHPKPGEFALDSICKRYGIPLHDRHTAAGDAFITAQLFMKVLARLKKKGNHRLGDFIKV
ncbi:MAG: 3'-5' exonuclease [Saprospiraceae bacterium]|nr:3'-5' exonuclease [Saprospiraceae bacterium]